MLATQDDLAESHLTAARSALRKGDIGQARDEVRLARFAAGENTAEISILRARIAVADGRDPSNDLGDSLRLDPNFAEALVFKGDLFLKAGNYKDARDSAIAALKAHPDFVAAHELLADIAVGEGNLGQAVTSLQDALNLVAAGTDEFARLHDRLTSLQRCAAVELTIQSERNQLASQSRDTCRRRNQW